MPENESPDDRAAAYRAKRQKDVDRKFRLVTDALGYDSDDLLEEYQQGWLDRIRDRTKPAEDS